ncbi:hypothetical protein GCM10028791_03270 [Echinicola sediminis]
MKENKNIVKYRDYDLEDFLGDEFFIAWAKNPKGEENHFWEKWIAENVDRKETVTQAASIIRSLGYKDKPKLSDSAYVEIFEQVLKSGAKEESLKKQAKKSISWRPFSVVYKVAAAILVVLCSWLVFQTYLVQEPVIEAPINWRVSENQAGVRSTIRLGDGSVINLNSNSKLTFLEKFSDTLRLVKLEGEAFFDVQKDGRPFIVDLGSRQVEVMGTTFNVKSPGNGGLAVALVSGKVKVKDQSGKQVILKPAEMLMIEQNGEFLLSSFDPIEISGWKDKILVFKNDSKDEIIQKINDWYGVVITCDPEIGDSWAYSGEYHNESLENVLEGIKRTLGIDYTINGKKVRLIKESRSGN